MRWPWVSRARLETAEAYAENAARREQAALAKNDRLIEHLVLLAERMSAPAVAPAAEPPARQDFKQPPNALLTAAREVSPTNDRTYDYNLQLIWQHESEWSDQGKVDRLAERIRRGAVAD